MPEIDGEILGVQMDVIQWSRWKIKPDELPDGHIRPRLLVEGDIIRLNSSMSVQYPHEPAKVLSIIFGSGSKRLTDDFVKFYLVVGPADLNDFTTVLYGWDSVELLEAAPVRSEKSEDALKWIISQ